MNNTKEQRFLHVATYRLADLRAAETTGSAHLGSDIFEAEVTPALATTLARRLTDVCAQRGWRLVDVHVHPDCVEALVTGKEPDGENGEGVAKALDGAVYGEVSPRAAAMN